MKQNGKTAEKKTKHPLGLAMHIKKQMLTIFHKKLSLEQDEEAFNMFYLVSRQHPSYKQLPLPLDTSFMRTAELDTAAIVSQTIQHLSEGISKMSS